MLRTAALVLAALNAPVAASADVDVAVSWLGLLESDLSGADANRACLDDGWCTGLFKLDRRSIGRSWSTDGRPQRTA